MPDGRRLTPYEAIAKEGLPVPNEEQVRWRGFTTAELKAIARHRPPEDDSQYEPTCTCWKCRGQTRPK